MWQARPFSSRRVGDGSEDVPLDLIETRTFGSRVIYERYGRARGTSPAEGDESLLARHGHPELAFVVVDELAAEVDGDGVELAGEAERRRVLLADR